MDKDELNELTNQEYLEYKKEEYYKKYPISEDVELEEQDEINSKFKELSSQIKSGMMLNLPNSDIELYAVSEYSYEKREIIKSCLFEDIEEDIIEKMTKTSDIKELLFLKSAAYRNKNIKEYFNDKLVPELSTVKGVISDCENKFVAFDKFLASANSQIEKKDSDIKELNNKLLEMSQELRDKDRIIISYENSIDNNSFSEPKTFDIDVVIEEEDPLEVVEVKEKSSLIGKLFNKNVKKLPDEEDDEDKKEKVKKYTKKTIHKTIDNFDTYLLSANLSAKQLNAITNCIRNYNVSDENIVYMVENKLSDIQIENYGRLLNERKNMLKNMHKTDDSGDISKNDVGITSKNKSIIDSSIGHDMSDEIDIDYEDEEEDF